MTHLHDRFPGLQLGHRPLGSPTPVRQLDLPGRAPVWAKDDGAFGDGGWGGNKVRKLEWILPEAQRRGATTILTVGGLATNWGLATALYARDAGLMTALALVDQPLDNHVFAQVERLKASGATLYFTRTKARTIAAVPRLLLEHRPAYLLPAGGSNAVGALGYVEAAFEIAGQVHRGELPEPSHIVTAVGTGGTVAGLALGLKLAGLRTRPVGIVVNDALKLDRRTLVRLAAGTARLLDARGAALPPVTPGLTVETAWLGAGYGHATPEGDRAQELVANLDPVYSAKAMAGLLALNEQGRFGDGPVLFLLTHGPR